MLELHVFRDGSRRVSLGRPPQAVLDADDRFAVRCEEYWLRPNHQRRCHHSCTASNDVVIGALSLLIPQGPIDRFPRDAMRLLTRLFCASEKRELCDNPTPTFLAVASFRQRASRTAIRMRTNFACRRKMPPTLILSTIATSRRPSSIAGATQSCRLGT